MDMVDRLELGVFMLVSLHKVRLMATDKLLRKLRILIKVLLSWVDLMGEEFIPLIMGPMLEVSGKTEL
jgi:hypothetical protein